MNLKTFCTGVALLLATITQADAFGRQGSRGFGELGVVAKKGGGPVAPLGLPSLVVSKAAADISNPQTSGLYSNPPLVTFTTTAPSGITTAYPTSNTAPNVQAAYLYEGGKVFVQGGKAFLMSSSSSGASANWTTGGGVVGTSVGRRTVTFTGTDFAFSFADSNSVTSTFRLLVADASNGQKFQYTGLAGYQSPGTNLVTYARIVFPTPATRTIIIEEPIQFGFILFYRRATDSFAKPATPVTTQFHIVGDSYTLGAINNPATGKQRKAMAGYISTGSGSTTAGTVLTVTTLTNPINWAIGDPVYGVVGVTGILPGTVITGGAHPSWTVNNSQSLGTPGSPMSFYSGKTGTGSIAGTSLTFTSNTGAAWAIGDQIYAPGVAAETIITAAGGGAPGLSWVVNNSQTVGPFTTQLMEPWLYADSWARRLVDRLGGRYQSDAFGGTGYDVPVSAGLTTFNVRCITAGTILAMVADGREEALILAGGINDAGAVNGGARTRLQIQTALATFFTNLASVVLANAPTLPIVVLSNFYNSSFVGAGAVPTGANPNMAADVFAAVANIKAANPSLRIVAVHADTLINGSGSMDAPAGDGNADTYMNPDKTHINSLGEPFYGSGLVTPVYSAFQGL